MAGKGYRYRRVYLPGDVFEELAKYAAEKYGRSRGAFSLAAAEAVRAGLTALRGGAHTVKEASATAAAPDLERRVRELEELYAELAKTVAALEEEVGRLKEHRSAPSPAATAEPRAPAAEAAAAVREAAAQVRERRPERGRGALEILREEGFEEEGELKRKVKNARAVLARLAEEGAVLIRTARGFVAVHPELWERLRRDLELCKPGDLSPLEGKVKELYLLLAKGGLISYSSEKGWQLPEPLSGEKALEALAPVAEEGGGGSGAVFVFKCPQCGEELRGGSPEEVADAASKHVWKEHGTLVTTDALYRYIKRVG